MNTPIVMLVNVVLWSFGISAATLISVMLIDWLANHRLVREILPATASGVEIPSRIETAQAAAGRLQHPSAPRRRASVIQAAKAA